MIAKQIPAKSAKSAKKTKPSIDELVTDYKPPVVAAEIAPAPVPVAAEPAPDEWVAVGIPVRPVVKVVEKPALPPLPAIEDVEIEDGIPLPGSYSGRDWLPLLKKMKPKQSATLTIRATPSLNRSIIEANKLKSLGYFVKKRYPQAGIVRVWREV